MTQTPHPPRCHYDRSLGERVTRDHHDDCPNPDACPGCEPCLEGHCSVCGREHLDDAHPNTCPQCVAGVREDLAEISTLCAGLRGQAAYAEGYTWAAARIPGAMAMVLVGPSVTPDQLRARRQYTDERRSDPIPPLAVLAHWEDTWRTWLGQPPASRAGVTAALNYLNVQLTLIAQARPSLQDDGSIALPPEFPEFGRAIGRLRASLEQTLHDEQQPDRGVECFECGARLVRRHRDRRRCRHATPARVWFATVLSYREFGLPTPVEVRAARMACEKCDQGGIEDPRPGISWECLSCRMSYSPGEYATAVRRDLLAGDDGSGWSAFPVAADAAADITGRPVTVTSIRTWISRGDDIAVVCEWAPGRRYTPQLVFWPDVARRASETRQRGRRVRVA